MVFICYFFKSYINIFMSSLTSHFFLDFSIHHLHLLHHTIQYFIFLFFSLYSGSHQIITFLLLSSNSSFTVFNITHKLIYIYFRLIALIHIYLLLTHYYHLFYIPFSLICLSGRLYTVMVNFTK